MLNVSIDLSSLCKHSPSRHLNWYATWVITQEREVIDNKVSLYHLKYLDYCLNLYCYI